MQTEIIHHIPLKDIVPSKTNPRKHFPDDELKELASSIKDKGVIQPITVRLVDGIYEIIAGERRFRASKIAKTDTIPARVVELDDKSALEIQVIENLHRSDVHPFEEAAGYKSLIDNHQYTVELLSQKVGKDRRYIRERLQLVNLSKDVQKAFLEEKIQLGHALAICRVAEDKQKGILSYINQMHPSVRELHDHIRSDVMIDLASAPFNLTDGLLDPDAGPCSKCPYNTVNDHDLFGDSKGKGQCTKPKCFNGKVTGHLVRISEVESKKGNVVLSRTESAKVFRYNMLYDSTYKLASEKCWQHPKNHTYERLFPNLKAYFGLDEKFKLRKLFKQSDITKAVNESDWLKQKSQSKNAEETKHRRDRRRERIADELCDKALLKKLEKDISLPLLAEGIILTSDWYIDIDDIMIEVDPQYDKDADRDDDETKQKLIKHVQGLKAAKAQMLFLMRLLMCTDWQFSNILQDKYKIKKSQFKSRAAQLERKEWEAAKKSKGKKTPAPAVKEDEE